MSDRDTPTRSRVNTRSRLMDAAYEVFAEVGLDAASVEAICDRAGFTRGAFYSNFETKDQLFVQVVTETCEAKLAAVSARLVEISADPASTPESVIARVVEVASDSPTGVMLMAEFRMRAMRDPALAVAWTALQAGMRQRVATMIGGLVDAYGLRVRVPAADFAQLVLNSWDEASVRALIEGWSDAQLREQVTTTNRQLAAAFVDGFETLAG